MREREKVKINLIRVPFLHAVQTFLTTYTIMIKETAKERKIEFSECVLSMHQRGIIFNFRKPLVCTIS